MVYLILLIVGLSLGSFVNALVWRMRQNSKLTKKKTQKLSVLKGRSFCTHCKKILQPKDLLPIISWINLRGKCRYCGKKIEDTPVAELLTPALFLISYAFWPFMLDGFGWAVFTVWLAVLVVAVALFVYDVRWMILPTKLNIALFSLAVIIVVLRAVQLQDAFVIISAIGGSLVVGGIFYVLHRVSRGAWMGGGDVRSGFGIGLLVGSPILGFMTIFVASLLGSFIAIPQLLLKKTSLGGKLPFGPFLLTALFIVFLFGEQITQWYRDAFILY